MVGSIASIFGKGMGVIWGSCVRLLEMVRITAGGMLGEQ